MIDAVFAVLGILGVAGFLWVVVDDAIHFWDDRL